MILHIIEAVAAEVFIPLTVGGGVRMVADVQRLLNAGADSTATAQLGVTPLMAAARESRHLRIFPSRKGKAGEIPFYIGHEGRDTDIAELLGYDS